MSEQTPGGWPDASRPGVPMEPDRDGWHWLQFNDDRPIPTAWVAEMDAWASGAAYSPEGVVELGFHYIGPCLTPAEVAAREAAARREGIEAAAAVASKRAASRHSTVAHCHSDRSKKHMQIRADEAGQLVADIRALVEEVARAIAARRGWNWDLMPSFKDRFTRGCSHEECRDAARKWWGADGAPIAVFVEKPDCHDKTTQPTHPAHHAEG